MKLTFTIPFQCELLFQMFSDKIENALKSNTRRRLLKYYLVFIIIICPFSAIIIEKLKGSIVINDATVESNKIDWHDWDLIEQDELRDGLGERGKATYLLDYPLSSKLINETFGYNGYLSDKISLKRSLKDLRPEEYVQF